MSDHTSVPPPRLGSDRRTLLKASLAQMIDSPSLRAAAVMALGGLGFAAANILLARVLEARAFGEVALLLALVQIAVSFGPLGVDLSINRHRLNASAALLSFSFLTSLVIALLLAVVARGLYALSHALAACVAVGAAGASLSAIGAAFLRSRGRFAISLLLFQIHNYVLFGAAAAALLIDPSSAIPAALVIAGAYTLTAVTGVFAGAREARGSDARIPLGTLIKESAAGFGIGLAIQLLWQLERIAIPRMLSLNDLATFAAVASVAASPFRMIQMGTQFTLVPTLRNCSDRRSALRVMRAEGIALVLAVVLATVAVFALTPLVVNLILQGRYPVTETLVVAMVLTGCIKVGHGFAVSVVQALGSLRALARLHMFSWVGVVVGATLACAGSIYGITGVVIGTGIGWLVTTVAAAIYGVTTLRSRS